MTVIDGLAGRTNNALVPDSSRTKPDQEDFLRLLTVQLSHQDPLNPQDSSAFVEQLATFSSLEELGNIKSGLEALAMAQSSVVSASAVDFAGRMATIEGDSFTLSEGRPALLGAYVPDGGTLTATIKSPTGEVVKTIELGPQEAGVAHFTWDGTNDDGETVPPSTYQIEVTATDGDEERPATSLLRAPVESVSFDRGYAELRIMGRRYPLGAILEIGHVPEANEERQQ